MPQPRKVGTSLYWGGLIHILLAPVLVPTIIKLQKLRLLSSSYFAPGYSNARFTPYSADRQPCACGVSARSLAAFWGARWRCPQPYSHITPHSCPQCDAALHVTEDCVKCLSCGYTKYYDYPPADY